MNELASVVLLSPDDGPAVRAGVLQAAIAQVGADGTARLAGGVNVNSHFGFLFLGDRCVPLRVLYISRMR